MSYSPREGLAEGRSSSACAGGTACFSPNPPKLRDKDSNLDLRVQSAVSWPVRRSRIDLAMSRRANRRNDVVHATRLRFGPGSSRPRSRDRTLEVLRGGVLEPGARRAPEFMQAKATAIVAASFAALKRREDLSLLGGASCLPLDFLQLSITSFWLCVIASERQRRPSRVASRRAAMPPYD